jgi:hypothetical protein
MGAYATAFPGGVAVDDAGADALERTWGFRPPARPGMDTSSMLEAALAGTLEALYAVGGNFLDTLPQPADVERALAALPLRIHQDIVLSPGMLVPPGDTVFVLPARTRYEHRGGVTETTTERRVSARRARSGASRSTSRAPRGPIARRCSTTRTPPPCAATSRGPSRRTRASRSCARAAISSSGAERGCARAVASRSPAAARA